MCGQRTGGGCRPALSPGINDPHTAIACIDYLGAMLVRLAQRKTPCSQRQDSDGVLRLIAPATLFPDILNTAFDEIRQYGRSSRAVNIRLVETLQSIAGKVKRASDREAILRQADMIERGAYESLPEHCDRADIDERLRAAEPPQAGERRSWSDFVASIRRSEIYHLDARVPLLACPAVQ